MPIPTQRRECVCVVYSSSSALPLCTAFSSSSSPSSSSFFNLSTSASSSPHRRRERENQFFSCFRYRSKASSSSPSSSFSVGKEELLSRGVCFLSFFHSLLPSFPFPFCLLSRLAVEVNDTLRALNVESCSFTCRGDEQSGIVEFSRGLKANKGLRSLNLRNNQIDDVRELAIRRPGKEKKEESKKVERKYAPFNGSELYIHLAGKDERGGGSAGKRGREICRVSSEESFLCLLGTWNGCLEEMQTKR